MTYEAIAEFVKTYWSLYFVALFLVMVGYALRPKNRRTFEDAAQIPLRED